MSQAIYGFADKTSQDSRLCFSNDSAVVLLNGGISQIEPHRLPTCPNDFSSRPITYVPQWHYFPVCLSYPDFNINGLDKSEKTGVRGIQHVMLKICTVGVLPYFLFYSIYLKGIMLNLCLFSFTLSTMYSSAGFRLLLQLLVEHPFGQLVMTTSEVFLSFQNAPYNL